MEALPVPLSTGIDAKDHQRSMSVWTPGLVRAVA